MSKFKVGDRVEDITKVMSGEKATVISTRKGSVQVRWDSDTVVGYIYWPDSDFRLIQAETKSPIRTVTRKEIVPGVYGIINVLGRGLINITSEYYTPTQLREAAHILNQIAEALDDV